MSDYKRKYNEAINTCINNNKGSQQKLVTCINNKSKKLLKHGCLNCAQTMKSCMKIHNDENKCIQDSLEK